MPAEPSPAKLLDLGSGYQRSQTLFALIELGIPTLLTERPWTLEEIAARLGADPLAMDRFLNACVALDLLMREGEQFRNVPDAEHYLVRGKSTYLGEVLRHLDRASYPAWSQLAERLRTWHPARPGDDTPAAAPVAPRAGGLEAQHQLSLLFGAALASVVDLSAHRCLLDLGGGTGAMSIALCRRYPKLRAIVLEIPRIAAEARTYVQASGLEDRIEVRAGDFTRDPLPEGCDAVLLANLLSLACAESNYELLRRIHAFLPRGGVVLLSGWMLDDDRTGPLLPILFCLEDINWGAADVERSVSDYRAWLESAGFRNVTVQRYLEPASVLIGRKE